MLPVLFVQALRKEYGMHVSQMLDSSPGTAILTNDSLIRCIEACFDCAQSCSACADACLGEQKIEMLRRCIRLNMDCADVCITTGRMLSRQQQADLRVVRAQLDACLVICAACGDECMKHGSHHEHCRVCGEACRACAKACQDAIAALGAGNGRQPSQPS
jgi:hypothetical protein